MQSNDQASGLQEKAYSRASSSRAVQRRAKAAELQAYNRQLREVQQLTQKTRYYDRDLSPHAKDPAYYETRLPNTDNNYKASPAAKRAI